MLYHLLRPIALTGINLFYNSVSVENQDRIPKKGPVIFAANHPNTMMDPLIVAASCGRRVSFLARSTLFMNSFTSWVMSAIGIIPVYRKVDAEVDMHKNEEMFSATYRHLERNHGLLIFPEGTRSLDGKMKPFKKGGIILAINAGLPIVPMACCGTYDVLVKGSKTFNPKSIELRFAPPISTKQNDMDNRNEITKRVENEVKRLKSEWNNIDLN